MMSRNAVRTTGLTPEPISPDLLGDVLRRRIHLAPDHLVREYINATPSQVQYYLEARNDYALVALYPPSESRSIAARVRRFGQAFPGLFNVNGIPRSHHIRPFSYSQPSFTGGVQTRGLIGPLLMGSNGFRSVVVTNCFLRLEPDTSIALTRLLIKSPGGTRSFRYKVYFAFAVAFGRVAKSHEFVERFEDIVVRYFERNDNRGVTEVAEGELTVVSTTTE